MKKLLLIMMLIVMISMLWSETVVLKGGLKMMGEIVAKQDNYLYVLTNDGLKKVNIENIKEIRNDADLPTTKLVLRKKDFNESQILSGAKEIIPKLIENKKVYIEKSNKYRIKYDVKMLPITIVSGFLAWRSIQSLGYYQDQIDNLEKQLDIENLDDESKDILEKTLNETEKVKNNIILNSFAFSVSSILSVAVSFDKVEIKANSKAINVSYKF